MAKGRTGRDKDRVSFRFEEAFSSADFVSERSLLLSFEASLPRVERGFIGGLQRAGAGKVTIIVDESDYQQSFADATAAVRVNVDYSFLHARVKTGHGRFHPKCYLLLKSGAARLFVASANLTSTGLRTNLEIVDRLDLATDDAGRVRGNVEAFHLFVGFLERLPTVVHLSATAEEDLQAARSDLATLLEHSVVDTPGQQDVAFLGTLDRALLSQVQERIPADAVRRIVAISPFFDPDSAAVLALAKAYPRACLEVFKDSEAEGDINGDRLEAIATRLKLFGVSGTRVEGEQMQRRRLHAKAFLFVGPQRAWLLQGSPNLTAAAWLRSAIDGGNIEAATLRHVQPESGSDPLVALGGDRLLESLDARSIAFAGLRYRVPVPEPDAVSALLAIDILNASARPGSIELRCRSGSWVHSSTRLVVHFATRDQSVSLPATVAHTTAGEAMIAVDTSNASLEGMILGSLAVVVTLDACDDGGARFRGRAWLSKPDFLASSSTARARRHALALMSERLFVEAPHLRRVAEWLAETSALLATALFEIHDRHDTRPHAKRVDDDASDSESRRASQEPRSNAVPDEDVSLPDPFEVIDDSTLRFDDSPFDDADDESTRLPGDAKDGVTLGMRAVAERLTIASRLVGVLFDQSRDARAIVNEGHSSLSAQANDSAAMSTDRDSDGHSRLREEATLLRQSATDLRAAVARLARDTPSTGSLSDVIDAFEVLTAFLYRLELQARHWESDAVPACAIRRRDALASLFSIEGWSLGVCRSWMVRAWADETLRQELHDTWHDEDRVARLLALVAAGTALDGEASALSAEMIVGLKLVTGTSTFGASTTLRARLRHHATTLAEQSRGLLTIERVLSAIPDLDVSATTGAAATQSWMPAIGIAARARKDRSGALDQLDLLLRSNSLSQQAQVVTKAVFQQVQRRREVGFLRGTGGPRPACSECGVELSTALVQGIGRGSDKPHACESCGALIAPLAWRDPICEQIAQYWAQHDDAVRSYSAARLGE